MKMCVKYFELKYSELKFNFVEFKLKKNVSTKKSIKMQARLMHYIFFFNCYSTRFLVSKI